MERQLTRRWGIWIWVVLSLAVRDDASANHATGNHWLKRTDLATITVVDDTGGRFPVVEAARNWNHSGRVRWSVSSHCTPPRPCVLVRVQAMNYLGITYFYVDGDNHFTSVSIYLSSTRAMSASKRLSVTCHEMGHALGLGHRPDGADSCMTNGAEYPARPDAHDFSELDSIYLHSH